MCNIHNEGPVAEGVAKQYCRCEQVITSSNTQLGKRCVGKRLSNTLDMALSKALTLVLLQQKTVVI